MAYTEEQINNDMYLSSLAIKNKILSAELRITSKRGRSKVWTTFGKIENMHGQEIPNLYACKTCFNVYKCSNNSTSNLNKHKCYVESCSQNYNSPKVEVDSEAKTDFLNIFTEWTIENCRPFKIVEDAGFIKVAEFLISIGAKYGKNVDIKGLLPHSTTVSRNITKIHNTHFQKVKQEIATVKDTGFGLTSDLWKDNYLKRTYVALTIQYVKDQLLMSRLLGMKYMESEKATSEKINSKVCKILKEFDLGLDKAIIVTDRGANMVAAFRRNNHIYCIDHLLHNTLQKSMQEVSDVEKLSRMCSKLVKYFKVSGLNSKLPRTLKSFSPTRWNSIYFLLSSIEENWPNIVQLLQEHNELNRIHDINLSHITAIVKVLQPFQEAFTTLEAENYVTIHLVYMMVHNLQNKCISDSSDLDLTKQLKERLSIYLESVVLNNLTTYHKIAVFLFPPANKLLKFSDDDKKIVKDECRRIMANFIEELPDSEQQNQAPVEHPIKDFYFEYVQAPHSVTFVDQITSELTRYESLTIANFTNSFNVLQWWDLHKTEYPLLYKLSCQILATPASSASSERVFSAARNLISEKRCYISSNEDSVNEIMFLHSNIKK